MKKAAIFVEGQTELVFVEKLFEELAGPKQIQFDEQVWKGSQFISLQGKVPTGEEKYFVLIVDCHGDHAVKSAILDRRPNLIKARYELILGLRDLHPIPSRSFQIGAGLAISLANGQLPNSYLCRRHGG